jgi:hypothetical protein
VYDVDTRRLYDLARAHATCCMRVRVQADVVVPWLTLGKSGFVQIYYGKSFSVWAVFRKITFGIYYVLLSLQ